MTSNAVSVLPPTGGIKDSATRGFLDALTSLLDARSGYTDKNAPERFITAAEFQGLANRAIVQAFSAGGDGVAPGAGGAGDGIPSARGINDSIDNLADFIRKSLIYQILGEQTDLVDISSLRQRIDSAQAGINRVETTRTDADMALASAINTIWASIGGSEAVIEDGSLASATPNTSEATRWTQVQSAVRDPNTGQTASSSILQETRTYASNADGKFNSIYSVRAQVSTGGQTVVGGFGLSATGGAGSGAGPTIDFGVRADKFFIAATSATPNAASQIAQGSSIPFMVLTSSQVVNGVVYAPGVYIKKAVIGDATIGNAQIGNAEIDTLKIGGETVTALRTAVGGSGFVPAGGTANVCSVVISMPPGSSGVLVSFTVTLIESQGGGAGSMYVTIYKNGSPVRTYPTSVNDGFYIHIAGSYVDPSPTVGAATYSMVLQSPTSGPGSNQPFSYEQPIMITQGAKR